VGGPPEQRRGARGQGGGDAKKRKEAAKRRVDGGHVYKKKEVWKREVGSRTLSVEETAVAAGGEKIKLPAAEAVKAESQVGSDRTARLKKRK